MSIVIDQVDLLIRDNSATSLAGLSEDRQSIVNNAMIKLHSEGKVTDHMAARANLPIEFLDLEVARPVSDKVSDSVLGNIAETFNSQYNSFIITRSGTELSIHTPNNPNFRIEITLDPQSGDPVFIKCESDMHNATASL